MGGKPSTSRDPGSFERRVVRLRRIARTMMWACVSLATVSAALWAASLRWTTFRVSQFGDSVVLKGGTLSYIWTTEAFRQQLSGSSDPAMREKLTWEWHCRDRATPMEWWPPVYFLCHPTGLATIAIHLGVPFGVGLTGTLLSRRWLRRHPRPGQCPTCGYPTSGLPTGVCPDCGRPLPPPYPFRQS